jgi:hypothetical protein
MKHINKTTNRNFGIVFCIFFLIIAFWPILSENQIRIWSVILSILFFVLGIINSKLLTPLNNMWFKFGILLGKVISPIIMAFVFFFVVFPTGLIMRLIKKDILNLKFNKKDTYWISRKIKKTSMKRQF